MAISPVVGNLIAYFEDDNICFVIAVSSVNLLNDQFGGVVVYSNQYDDNNPVVGRLDTDWWTNDNHFKILDDREVGAVFSTNFKRKVQ